MEVIKLKQEWLEIKNESLIIEADAKIALQKIHDNTVQCCVTSPPYWSLRDYNVAGHIGSESTLNEYINRLVEIFSEIKRVLKDDGVLWLNIGDVYTSGNRGYRAPDRKNPARAMRFRPNTPKGLKPKDLIGLPWRVAFALQRDGWYLRSDIIWHKPNCMPESVKDRPTRSHEYVFLFSKSERYYYDYEAIREENRRNRRTVWSIKTQGYNGAHFATFPSSLIEPCIIAGSRTNDFVIDPFFGSGTVGVVCNNFNRKYIGIEINPDYVNLSLDRIQEACMEIPKRLRV